MTTLASVVSMMRDAAGDGDLRRRAAHAVRERWDSEVHATGLRRDLSAPHVAPKALIDISIRTLLDRDVPVLLETDRAELTAEEKWDRTVRRHILEAGIGTCYVAATANDEAAYMQWMFTHRDNEVVGRHFDGVFPPLDADTVLLEGAFTPEAHRGKRIMSAAMSQIAEHGADHGARYVITFVGDGNEASLKGCARAGFAPHIRRVQRWQMMRQTISFVPI